MKFLILFVFILFNGVASAEEIPVKFPEKIGSLKFIDRKDYEKKEFGYSLRYQNEQNLKVDVFIYDKGIKNLEDGIESPAVIEEFKNVVAALHHFEKKGNYKGVKELAKGEKKFEDLDISFIWSKHSYSEIREDQNEVPRVSQTYITVLNGKFLKFRTTSNLEDMEKNQKDVDLIVHGIAKVMYDSFEAYYANLDPDVVIKSIQNYLKNPTAPEAEDWSSTFVNFAANSDKINIVIHGEYFPWYKEQPVNGELLLYAYFAGNVLKQLETKVAKDAPESGTQSVIDVYQILRKKKKIVSIQILEDWSSMKMEDIMKQLVVEKE